MTIAAVAIAGAMLGWGVLKAIQSRRDQATGDTTTAALIVAYFGALALAALAIHAAA